MARREGETFTGEIKRNINQVKDRWKGGRLDFDKVKNDPKFDQFLKDTEQTPDWTKDKTEIRDAYVNFERTQKVTERYQLLFENKLKNLAPDNKEIKNEIAASLIELAKNNPEELRKMEKLVTQVMRNEVMIGRQQDQIDAYKSKGGKEGINEKITTLQKANSKFGNFLMFFRAGDKYKLAKEKARIMYGMEKPEQIKDELKKLNADVQNISKLEKAKANTKNKFSKARAQIYLNNGTAKQVQEKIAQVMDKKLANIGPTANLEKAQDLKKDLTELRKQFLSERGIEKKKDIEDEDYWMDEEFDFIKMTPAEFDNMDRMMDEYIKESIDEKFAELVNKTPPNKLEEEIQKYFKQAEFAGMTALESRKKIYEALVKVKETFPAKDDKTSMLSKVLTKLEYAII